MHDTPPRLQPYSYKPLEKGEIRLLQLNPTVGEQLSGSIVHVPLTRPIFHPATTEHEACLEHQYEYEAISYTWGTDTHTPYQLLINDNQIIQLTANLYFIVQQLVRPDTTVIVWIDAICIHQADKDSEEKAQQIRLMPDIYRIAKRVQVHLGPEADDSPLAIKFIEHIVDYSEYLDDSLNVSHDEAYALAREKGFVMPEYGHRTWHALRSFWMRPWFRRVWVIQEIVYATDLVIYCGDLEIDWRKLWIAACVLHNNTRLLMSSPRWNATSYDVALEDIQGANAFFTMVDLRLRARGYMSAPFMVLSFSRDKTSPAAQLIEKGFRHHENIPMRHDLAALIKIERFIKPVLLESCASGSGLTFAQRGIITAFHQTRSFLATNPVDRIYAVLRLVNDVNLSDADFRIEYSAEQIPAVVCTRFAAGLIKRGQGAAVLALAGTTAQAYQVDPTLPSWVPHWTTSIDPNHAVTPMSLMMHIQMERNEGFSENRLPYCAAGASKMEAKVHQDRRLIVRGVRIDTVSCITQGQLFAPPTLYEIIIMKLKGAEAKVEAIEDALWRTMIANRTFDGLEPPEEYATQYRAYKQRLYFTLGAVLALLLVVFLLSLPFIIAFSRMVGKRYHVLLISTAFLTGMDDSPWISIAILMLLRSSSIPIVVIGCSALAWRTQQLVITYGLIMDRAWSVFAGAAMAFNTAGLRNCNGPPECAQFLKSLIPIAGHYNLAVTATGRLALVPLAAQIGDEVVSLEGGYAPFLLRRVDEGGEYRLVGESYVHGVMKGELWGDEKLPLVEFCLV